MKINKKNSLLMIIFVLLTLFSFKLLIDFNTINELKFEKEHIIKTMEDSWEDDNYDIKVNVEIIKDEKMVVMYDYIEEDSIMWYPKGYEEISQSYSGLHYETQKKENKYNFVHVYLNENLDIYYITVNGVTVYKYTDDKETNKYYKVIYDTILEKTLNNEVEYFEY